MATRYSNPRNLRKVLGIGSIILLILIPLSYAIFRASPLIIGPQISITSLKDGDTVASSTFQLVGIVKRANKIILQGKPITIDGKGQFSETLVAYPPYTILVLVATDQYGKAATTTLRVIPR